MKFNFIFLFSILALFSFGFATDVSTCQVLSTANGVYNLINNITYTGSCINITANNITFDGQGFTLIGTGVGNAINTTGADFDRIQNIRINNFANGIAVHTGSTYINITNATIYNSATNGIYTGITISTDEIRIRNSTIFNSTVNGIYDFLSANVYIDNNHFYNNGKDINFSAISLTTPNIYTTNNIFDTSAGDYSTYVNASFNDTTTLITTNWAVKLGTLPATLPAGYLTFNNKYLNFTSVVADDLDTNPMIAFTWDASEVVPLNPNNHPTYFKIYSYKSSWSAEATGLNTTANRIWVNNTGIQIGNTIIAILQLNDSISPNVSTIMETTTNNVDWTMGSPYNNSFKGTLSNLTFNFTVVDNMASLLSCSLVLNGVVNQTNTSTKNYTGTPATKSSFVLTNLETIPEGIQNWSINCTDDWYNTKVNGTYKFEYAYINSTITTPTPYSSPNSAGFNITIPTNVINGYITRIDLGIYDFSNNLISSQNWTNTNTSITSTTMIFPTTTSSVNYRIVAHTYTNLTDRITNTVEIYPRTILTNDQYFCTPPTGCISETITHSNGEKFYLVEDNDTCPNLGIGQLQGNIKQPFGANLNLVANFNPISGLTSSVCNKVYDTLTYPITQTGNNHEISLPTLYIQNNSGSQTTGSAVHNLLYRFKYNLTGTLTQVITFANLTFTNTSGCCNGQQNIFNITLFLDNMSSTAYPLFASNGSDYGVGGAVYNLAGTVYCYLNSSGIFCNGGTAGDGGIATTYNQALDLTNRELWFVVSASSYDSGANYICNPLRNLSLNFKVSNAFLNTYTGFQNYNQPNYTKLGIGTDYGTDKFLITCPFNTTTNHVATNISNPQPTVQLMLFYNNQVIIPYIWYGQQIWQKTYSEATLKENPNMFKQPSGSTMSYNNSIIYVYSKEANSWFLIPPFNLDNSTPYIVNLVLDIGGTELTPTTTVVPKLPLEERCNDYNNTYYITAKYPTDMTYQVSYIVNQSGNMTSYSSISYGSNFTFSMPINGATNITSISYYANAYKKCEWSQNGTLALSGVDLSPDVPLVGMFFDATLLFLTGMSAVFPALIIITAVYNDAFHIIPNYQMGVLILMVAFISYVSNWWGSRNLKTLTGLVIFGLAFLIWFNATEYGIALPSENSGFQNSLDDLMYKWNNIAVIGGTSGTVDWTAVLLSSIGLVVSFADLIIQSIFMIPSQIGFMLMQINPLIGSIFVFFAPYLILYGVIWLSFKAYEIITKQYISI